MCWLTFDKKASARKIAEKDIIVYKIMYESHGNIYSWFKDFPYEAGVRYVWGKELKPSRIDDYWRIEKGFHSYNCKSTFILKENNSVFGECWSVRDCKFYTRLNQYSLSRGSSREIKKITCIIPKGSIYYENEKGEVVSNQIIITI